MLNFILPVDVVAAEAFKQAIAKIVTVQEIPKDWMGLDIGPCKCFLLFSEALQDANTILWNGPMGVYEMDKFAKESTKFPMQLHHHLPQQ